MLRKLKSHSVLSCFTIRMDGIKRYMEHHEIPEQLQDRVKRWLQYSWSR